MKIKSTLAVAGAALVAAAAEFHVDPSAAPDGVLKQVHAAVDGFVKDAEQFDDLTMLCLEYKGEQGGETPVD